MFEVYVVLCVNGKDKIWICVPRGDYPQQDRLKKIMEVVFAQCYRTNSTRQLINPYNNVLVYSLLSLFPLLLENR